MVVYTLRIFYVRSFMHDKIQKHKKPGRHQLKLNFHLNKEFGHIK